MSLLRTEEDRAFQREVREFISDAFPADMRGRVSAGRALDWEQVVDWHRILAGKGWLAPAWPEAHGGSGWPIHWLYIFEEELALAGCPPTLPTNTRMIGPILIAHGTPAQRERYLPGILGVRDWWCQGYSEPGSGSDLASLRTRAVRDGDDYVVNGQKIWTSFAQHCNRMFCLVRTDPEAKPQAGISFLLIDDLGCPGLTVRPIRLFNGQHHFNEVFFDDVRIPRANLVGDENDGWTVAKSLLAHERLGGSRGPESKRIIGRIQALAGSRGAAGRTLDDESWFQRRLWSLEVDHIALQQSIVRFVTDASAGRPLGSETSMLKARGNLIHQAAHDLLTDALAYYGLPLEADVLDLDEADFFGPPEARGIALERYASRGVSVAGGTQEIQSVVTAKRVLGL